MRRLLLILSFIPFLLFGQTDLNPKVAWRTNVSNVTMLTDSTYQFEVMPIDWNEAGASELRYGNYFQDYAGNKYQIIDSTYLKVTVYDVFKTGVSPQPDRIGIMYLTPLNGESDYLAPVDYSYLDQSALDNARGIELAYLWKNINQFPQTGVIQLPVITRVGDGTITLEGGVVSINTLTSGQGRNVTFSMPDTTLIPTDNGVSYVYADYNSGEPVYRITTNRDQFLTNFTLIPVIRISREGTIVHFLEYDEYGVQLANKMNLKDIFIHGFQRESGLILSTSTGRISTVSAGRVVFSVQWWDMVANISGTSGLLYEYYRSGGAWNRSLVTSYDAIYYCDGVNRQTLGNNQFVSKYFFRDAGDDNEVYYIHGDTYNKFSDALAEALPPVPELISSHSIYVGKIVIQQGATNGSAFPRAWDTALEKNASQRHGDLSELTWMESGHTGELKSVAGFDSLGSAIYVGLDTIQFSRDTLTWDATKKDLKDSTAYLKTLIEQAEARFPDFANSLQSTTGTQDTLIMTPLRVYEMIQMLSVQPYGEEEDLYLKGRKIISDSLIVDGVRAENGQIELLGNLQVSDTLKVERIQLIDGYTEGYYLKIGANGNVEVSAISGAMVYKGTWDASTNTPALANGTGTNGWYYRVVVGGTQNLGGENITFSAGDDVLYDGLIWQRVPSPTYSLQPATISTLGGVKIGSNISVTEDGTISTHAQQNIYTNGLAGNISILNGSTLNLNVNDADASTTNEIQAISILNDVISITRYASTVDLGYLQDSIYSVRGYVNTVKGVILNEINLGKDSIQFEVDTLKTSLYDSIYSHKLRLEDLEALDVVEFSDLSGIRDSVSNNKDSIVTHNTRLLALESLDIVEGSNLSGIRDSISVNSDSIQAHNLRLLVVEGLDTTGIYHFNRGFLDQITSKAQLVSDTLVWDATKNDLKVMVRDSISGLRSELTAYFNLKLSDSTAYLRAIISDSTLFLRGELSNLELEFKDSILDHRVEIDSLKNVTSSLKIPEKATTLETVTSTESEDYVTPKTLKEFLELSYVPYYGSNEDLYTKKVTADSLILRDLTGEGVRAVAVDSKGKLIDTLLVFDDISELTLWNKGQSDSIKGLLYWNQIQSDSLKIIADSLAFYVVTGDDSIRAHRVELQALKDSIFDHRTELEIIKDTLVDHNLRLIPLERLDTTGIYHDNRNYLDLLADQAQERRDTLTFDATKYDLRKMVGDSTFYLKEMIGDSTEYLKTLIDSVNTKNYIEVDSIKIKNQVAHGIITGGEQTPYLISKAYMDSVLTLIIDERTVSYVDTTGNFLVVSERPALIKYLILDGIGTVKIGRTLDGSDILIDRVVDQKVKIVLTKYFEETLYWTTTGTISFKMWYKYTDENIGSGYDSGYWEGY